LVEYLQDFLVLKDGGKVIFSTVSEIIQDQLLFGGFLEAVNTIFTVALRDELQCIEGKRYRIAIFNKGEFQFIGISDMAVESDQTIGELRFFANRFVNQFEDSFPDNGDNDVRIFQCFNNQLNKSRKELIVELIQGI